MIPRNHILVREAEGQPKRELWFLHGYGSNEQDLFGLARLLPSSWCVRSLRAPFPLAQGGYSWYDLHFDARGVRHTDPAQVRESLDWLKELLKSSECRPILFGFSQGGIMANALAMSSPELISACVAVASYAPTEWFTEGFECKPDPELPHLAVVGTEDGVIPPGLALPSYERAIALGAPVDVHTVPMGHGLAPEAWQRIASWLKELDAARNST